MNFYPFKTSHNFTVIHWSCSNKATPWGSKDMARLLSCMSNKCCYFYSDGTPNFSVTERSSARFYHQKHIKGHSKQHFMTLKRMNWLQLLYPSLQVQLTSSQEFITLLKQQLQGKNILFSFFINVNYCYFFLNFLISSEKLEKMYFTLMMLLITKVWLQ